MSIKEFWKLSIKVKKKKTNDDKRKSYKAETQETTFKSNTLEVFAQSLKSGGQWFLAPSTRKPWDSFLGPGRLQRHQSLH